MKRVHVLEFEDLEWFPAWLRAAMTNVLVVLLRAMGSTRVIAGLVSRVLEEQKIDRVVDLGSGSGGALPEVIELVRANPQTADARLTMTDLYPNPEAVQRFDEQGDEHIRFLEEPVDASRLESAPPGLKTMVNCFHHMRPPQARAILESARAGRQPILVYEIGDNEIPFPVWCIGLPIGLTIVAITCLFFTPFVRPMSFRQLFFTYVIPIIPLFYAWDGQSSMPRIYTLGDLDELLDGLDGPDYVWEKGYARSEKGKNQGIYLLGRPA